MNKDLPYSLEDVQETLSYLNDWTDRYQYLIELGEKFTHLDDTYKIPENAVKGCVAQVWMIDSWSGDYDHVFDDVEKSQFYFLADTDSHIVKGLIALLMIIFNGQTAKDILEINVEEIFKTIGLEENLSPNRRNGFFSIVSRIKKRAEDYQQ